MPAPRQGPPAGLADIPMADPADAREFTCVGPSAGPKVTSFRVVTWVGAMALLTYMKPISKDKEVGCV